MKHVRDWERSGLPCFVVKHEYLDHYRGYVTVPPGHPFSKLHADHPKVKALEVVGGSEITAEGGMRFLVGCLHSSSPWSSPPGGPAHTLDEVVALTNEIADKLAKLGGSTVGEKTWDNICLERWDDLYTSESGRGHAEHLCPLPFGHREDHICICEWDDPRIAENRRLREMAHNVDWCDAHGQPIASCLVDELNGDVRRLKMENERLRADLESVAYRWFHGEKWVIPEILKRYLNCHCSSSTSAGKGEPAQESDSRNAPGGVGVGRLGVTEVPPPKAEALDRLWCGQCTSQWAPHWFFKRVGGQVSFLDPALTSPGRRKKHTADWIKCPGPKREAEGG